MNEHPTSNELTQRDLYKPENVVAYLRSIESNSIAGMQYRHAADEIERLRDELDETQRALEEAHDKMEDTALSASAHEPPAALTDDALVRAAAAAGFEDRHWRVMFYEKGPYDVTFPTVQIKDFAKVILERHAQPASAQPPPADEVAWLVELPGLRLYRTMSEAEGIRWTADIDKAIRFCRRIDAERFCEGDPADARVVEHMWCSTATKGAGQ